MRTRVFGFSVLALAVALGIALGAGPLQHDAAHRARDLTAVSAQLATARHQLAELTVRDRAASAFTDATATALVRSTLIGHPVALVSLPGADPRTLTALRALLASAGATVAADVTLGAPLATATSRQLVEALTSQMMTDAKLPVPATSDGYQRLGLLLARAIGVPSSAHAVSAPYDPTALGIMAGFGTAGLVTSAKVTARSALVLVVTGPAARSTDAAAENVVPVTFLRTLATQTGVVVAGPSSAAGGLGIIGSLRSGSPGLTTTDGVEVTRGRLVAVLALVARARGLVGSFGAVGRVDSPVPPA